MEKKLNKNEKRKAIIGLLILIAIGGLVLFGEKDSKPRAPKRIPKIQGPSTPPPNYIN